MKPIKRTKKGHLPVAEARKLFIEIAKGRPFQSSDRSPDLNDAWNWFRAGIRMRQMGMVTASDISYLRKTPAATGEPQRP